MEKIQRAFSVKILEDTVYFKVVFLLWGLLHSLSLGQYVTSYVSPIILVWGGLLVIKKILIDRLNFPLKYLILIFAFWVGYVVTIIANRDLNFIGNTKTLIWAVIMMVALFINDCNKDKEEILSDISRISRVMVIATLIITGIALLQFFFGIDFWIERVDGARIPQGYYAARLWGMFVDPNQACNVALISLALSGILLIRKTLLNKFILILNILAQYFYIVLSGSRGGEIGLIILLTGVIYLNIDKILSVKIRANVVRTIVGVVGSLILSLALILTFPMTRKAIAYIPEMGSVIKEQVISHEKSEEVKDQTQITVERPDTDTSNGRVQLWIDGFKLSKEFPILGVGDRNIMIMADKLMPGSSITKQYVHNGYLHMLLSGGIVSLVIMMILVGMIAIQAVVKILNRKKYDKEYYIHGLIASMLGSILITTIFLTEIFFQNSFTAAIFWIFMGYVVYLNKNERYTCK